MQKNYKNMNVLLVSDVHLAIGNIEVVKDQLLDQQIHAVLLTGDICNLKGTDYVNEEVLSKAARNIAHIIEKLNRIANNGKVYWIPGNHDPMPCFEGEDLGGINVHKKVVKLADGLVIAGFGGAVPAFDESGNEVWEGYPFENEKQFELEFVPFLNNQVLGSEHHGNQILLMTHVGPYESDTVKVRRKNESSSSKPYSFIYSGSSTLQHHLEAEKLQERVLLNAHGHTHLSKGHTMLCKIPIVNAGSLMEGNWAVINLKRDEKESKSYWYVQNVQLLHFNI